MYRKFVAACVFSAFATLLATSTSAEEATVIARLAMRDRTITISSTTSALLYTVKDAEGTVLEANLSEAQLQARYPEIYDLVQPAIATPGEPPTPLMGIWGGL